MILTRDDVKELTRTGSLEVVLTKAPSTKDVQAVQMNVGQPAIAKVRILEQWPHRSGGHVVVIELVSRSKSTTPKPRMRQEPTRLLKPGRGTTTDARNAMRVQHEDIPDPDTTGVPYPNLVDAEPQMVDTETEQRFAQHAHRSQELRFMDQQRRNLIQRLDRTLEGCERLGLDPTRHVAAFDRRLTDLEKQVRKAERKKAA